MRAILKLCLFAPLLLILGACASGPGMTPVTTLGEMACSAQPDLAQAQVLQMGAGMKVTLDPVTRCWKSAEGAASSYVVFKLPVANDGYMLLVSSEPRGIVLLSPRLFILDAQGGLLRDVANEKFMFRGADFGTSLRARPGDAYLVVASDPASIGGQVSNIVGSVTQGSMVAGPFIVQTYTGSERNEKRVFSHNGVIEAKAEPLPKAN